MNYVTHSLSFPVISIFYIFLINVVSILMMLAKLATPDFLKIMIFQNKDFEAIIFVHGMSNKVLSCDSNYTVFVVLWPKFGNSIISMKEVLELQFYKDLTRKTSFFEGCFCFKFNNLGLA